MRTLATRQKTEDRRQGGQKTEDRRQKNKWDETSLRQGYGSAGELVPPFRSSAGSRCHKLCARVTVDHRRCAKKFDRFARDCTERQRDPDRCRVRWTDDAGNVGAAQRFTGVLQRRGR